MRASDSHPWAKTVRTIPYRSHALRPKSGRLSRRATARYFGEFPLQPTLVRERLESRGYMVDRLRELMLLGQLSPVQKVELSRVLDTISRIIMNM